MYNSVSVIIIHVVVLCGRSSGTYLTITWIIPGYLVITPCCVALLKIIVTTQLQSGHSLEQNNIVSIDTHV